MMTEDYLVPLVIGAILFGIFIIGFAVGVAVG
jgi:hypothetical protein